VDLGFDLSEDATGAVLALANGVDELGLRLVIVVGVRVDEVGREEGIEGGEVALRHRRIDLGVEADEMGFYVWHDTSRRAILALHLA
jgi:hypothetical protein